MENHPEVYRTILQTAYSRGFGKISNEIIRRNIPQAPNGMVSHFTVWGAEDLDMPYIKYTIHKAENGITDADIQATAEWFEARATAIQNAYPDINSISMTLWNDYFNYRGVTALERMSDGTYAISNFTYGRKKELQTFSDEIDAMRRAYDFCIGKM